MDPVWATLFEFWWIGPIVIGTGALGWVGLRHQRSASSRHLALDSAKHELREARSRAVSSRSAVQLARAELARVQAERAASRASAADVAAARRALQTAQREAKAATATIRARRVQVTAARAALPTSTEEAALPLAKLMAAHDAVTARWMDYETDPAKLIAFPTMSDGRVPATAAYLRAHAAAQQLRPASPRARITPQAFAQYRDAVTHASQAFDEAEREAWRQARASSTIPANQPGPDTPVAEPTVWTTLAQQALERSGEVIVRAGEAAAAAIEARLRGGRDPGTR